MHRSQKQRVRATVLCWRDGQVLLVRRRGGKWNFPGGSLVTGEVPLQAACRELNEETGWCAAALLPLCTSDTGQVLHHVFSAQWPLGKTAMPANEIVACKWVNRRALAKVDLNATASALLAQSLPALVPVR